MKKNLLPLLVLLGLSVAHSQTKFHKYYFYKPSLIFSGSYSFNSFDRSSDNGYFIAGSRNNDGLLIKLDSIGDTLWIKTYRLNFGGTEFTSVKKTADGGSILAGKISTGQTSGQNDMLVVKTNSLGDTLWSKTYGMPTNIEEANNIIPTIDKGYMVVGTASIYFGNQNIYLVKIDSLGNLQWSKDYTTTFTSNFGASDIVQLKDGSFIVVGTNVSINGEYIVMLRTTSQGNIVWVKFIYPNSYGAAYAIDTTGNDFIVACGVAVTSPPSPKVPYPVGLLLKIDTMGSVVWWRAFADGFDAIRTTKDKGFILSNGSYSKVIKTDSLGFPIWATQLTDYSGISPCIMETKDGGYATLGNGPIGNPGAALIFSKLDYSGNTPCSNSISSQLDTMLQILQYNFTITASAYGTSLSAFPSVNKNYFYYSDTACVPSIAQSTIELYDKTGLNIFPNPFSTSTTLQSSVSLQNATLSVYNTMGQEVKQLTNISGQSITLQRGNLPSGIYFIRLTIPSPAGGGTQGGGTEVIATHKLIITDN